MSLAELRAELKSLRKSLNPVPASRMKKADIAMEIARLKGHSVAPKAEAPKTEEPKAEKPRSDKPKAEKKKVAEPKKEGSAKEATTEGVKKTKGVRESVSEVKVPTTAEKPKPAKGTEEMKARMAALRAKRKSKKEE